MAKADKATAVADIAEQFKASTATVVTEYRGLTDRYTEAEASVAPILAAVEQIYRRSLATPIPADTYGARL